MSSHLRISFRFLQLESHGRAEDGWPEWPPSPLRAFQALVAASLGRWEAERVATAERSLRWLEAQTAPTIVAARHRAMASHRTYVPDNVSDRVAASWSRGNDADIAEYRTEKDIHAVALDSEAVHYVFENAEGMEEHFEVLRSAARAVTHLGWGIDMVVGDAEKVETVPKAGEGEIVYVPKSPGRGRGWRVPVTGTLSDLTRRHHEFLNRLSGELLQPVAPLRAFAWTGYQAVYDTVGRPFLAYRIVDRDGRPRAFDAARRGPEVCAWLRHATAEAAAGWPFGPTDVLVHGHVPEGTTNTLRRISYLALPTLTPYRVEAIRRVVVTAPNECADELAWLDQRLSGHELRWNDRVVGFLEPLPVEDSVLQAYVGLSRTWSTVTPVVCPGHDDRSPRKAHRLLDKAFRQAGIPNEAIAAIEWSKVGYRPGVGLARSYRLPHKVTGPAYHVRVTFHQAFRGPLAVGSGRHRGVGLFARTNMAAR